MSEEFKSFCKLNKDKSYHDVFYAFCDSYGYKPSEIRNESIEPLKLYLAIKNY